MGLTTDVLVVGGGPAGLAAAIAARKKGFSVVVVDGAKPPIDKACGEGLLPGTLAALRELGITSKPETERVSSAFASLMERFQRRRIFQVTPESACGEPCCIRKWPRAL